MRAWMLVGGVIGGILITTALGQTTSMPATAPVTTAASRPVITVKTAGEFVKALGSDRIIELAAGDYLLTEVKRGVGPSYRWNENIGGGYELIIRNTEHLTIRGAGKEPAHIVTKDEYATVLNFDTCKDVELVNLKLGHAVAKGACSGGVVKVENCAGMRLERCDLYGSGIHGLELKKVQDLAFVESIIEDCSYGLVVAQDCQGLRFEKAIFRGCQDMYGFDLTDCLKVELKDCMIADNLLGRDGQTLFKTNLSDKDMAMHVTGGTIKHNAAKALVNVPEMLVVEGAMVEGNSWQAAPSVQKARGTRVAQASGSSVYTTDLGDYSFGAIAMKVYGIGDRWREIRTANPLAKEPIWPDTKIIIPR